MNNPLWYKLGGWAGLINGVIFGGVAIVMAISTSSFLSTASHVKGEVVELVERRSDDGGTTFAPVFTFTDNKGVVNIVYSSTSSYPPAFGVGETVEILYDSKDPEHAIIDTWFQKWGFVVIFGAVAPIGLILGTVFLLIARRMNKTRGGLVDSPDSA